MDMKISILYDMPNTLPRFEIQSYYKREYTFILKNVFPYGNLKKI